jgi:carnitine 3-dehydrogenase
MAGMLKVLDKPQITPELKRTIADGMMQEAENCSVEQIAKEEDELLVGLLRLRRKAAKG